MSTPRVFIVDDHALFRSGVRSELGDGVEVVGDDEDPWGCHFWLG